jgi:hypothetical protein
MWRLKFFLTTAALLLVAGCVVPVGGYNGGYGGHDYYGNNSAYPGDPSYEYPYPAPYYGYPGGEYTGDDAMVYYPPEPGATNPPVDYQTPVYPPGTDPAVSDPQSPYWRWQSRRQVRYHRRHRYRNHQEGPSNTPPETDPSITPGTDPPDTTIARPHRRQRVWGKHRANRHRSRFARRQGPRRRQFADHQRFPSRPRPHLANQHRRRRAPQANSTMSRPLARSKPRHIMRAPRPMGNTVRRAPRRAPQAQGRKPRQKRSRSGSQ